MRKRSIALVITAPGSPQRWLVVRRPDDDEDLPGVWGLPAGTLRPEESAPDLVRRIGREKLALRLEPGAAVAEGSAVRPGYRLEMSLWTAGILAGEPQVAGGDDPSPDTRYVDWRWDTPGGLAEGARRGSLCCRLGLDLASGDPTGGPVVDRPAED